MFIPRQQLADYLLLLQQQVEDQLVLLLPQRLAEVQQQLVVLQQLVVIGVLILLIMEPFALGQQVPFLGVVIAFVIVDIQLVVELVFNLRHL